MSETTLAPIPQVEELTPDQIDALIDRVNGGDKQALKRFRAFLAAEAKGRADCGVLREYGTPPVWLREQWLEKHSGGNTAAAEAMNAKLDQAQRELEGPDPTPLERLLAERAAYCWFDVYRREFVYENNSGMSIQQAEHHLRKIDMAHKRFLTACKTLATVRKMAIPALQVNIARSQLNVAGT
jgi:hypothetical protein